MEKKFKVKKGVSFGQYFKSNYDLYLFLLPALVVVFVFSYIPMYGIQIAFKDFSPRRGIWGSEWVGLEHFVRFFRSATAWDIIWNTFAICFYSLLVGFPMPIILALMLNSMNSAGYRKVIQSISYAPNFISVVVISGMIILFLSPSNGVVNMIMEAFGLEKINFMGEPDLFRHIYVWSGVWQGIGFGSIIYFSALTGVSPELHESAIVDGATKFQRIIHIDWPSIMPTASILLILAFGSLLALNFDKVFLLQNDTNLSVSETIPTYVYKVGLVQNDMGFSTAIGLMNSVVNAIALVTVNKISRKLSGNSLW